LARYTTLVKAELKWNQLLPTITAMTAQNQY
jgi:hypothetical protein